MTSRLSHSLIAVLQSSAQITALVSLLVGVLSHHLVFRPFEIDGYAWHLFFTYLVALFLLIAGNVYLAEYSVVLALARALFVATAYNSGVVISIFTYRAFFHPLNRFPGPFLAKLTRFYAMNDAAKRVQAYNDIQNLHNKYGDIVRVGTFSSYVFINLITKTSRALQYSNAEPSLMVIVGPRELSVNRPSAIKVIYEHPTQTTRSPWYAQVSNDVTKISLNSVRILKVHKSRKRAWERGFGFRGMKSDALLLSNCILCNIKLMTACMCKPWLFMHHE